MKVEFVVPGAPYGKGRARVGTIAGKARMFTPEKTMNYESWVAHFAAQAMGRRPLIEEAVVVHMSIKCPVPASWSKKKQADALAGRIFPKSKPDIDNVEKIIYDAINNVVWKDDVQVVDVVKRKRYSDKPGVSVRIDLAVPAESPQSELGAAA